MSKCQDSYRSMVVSKCQNSCQTNYSSGSQPMGRDPNWVAKGWLRVAKGRLVAKEKSGKCQGISGEIPRISKMSGKLWENQENFREFRGKTRKFQ